MHELQVVLLIVFAAAGYQEARRFGRQTGRTPWGCPPWGWAIILGLSFIIGIVLIAIAERQGRSQARHRAPFAPANYPPQPPIGVYSPDAARFGAPPPATGIYSADAAAPPGPPSPPPPPPPIGGYAPDTTVLPNL